jgi:hypothetical protein
MTKKRMAKIDVGLFPNARLQLGMHVAMFLGRPPAATINSIDLGRRLEKCI